jgi:hypothetical protein
MRQVVKFAFATAGIFIAAFQSLFNKVKSRLTEAIEIMFIYYEPCE